MMMNATATKPTPIVVDQIVMAVLQASFVPRPMIVPVAAVLTSDAFPKGRVSIG